MGTITEAVREQLMAGNQEYQRLREEHARYKTQLNELSAKAYLSVEEQTEELERDSLPEPGRSGIARRRIYR